jgi:hypothetical protein
MTKEKENIFNIMEVVKFILSVIINMEKEKENILFVIYIINAIIKITKKMKYKVYNKFIYYKLIIK